MRKSVKNKIICSPRPQMFTKTISRACPAHSLFPWHNDDIWTAISEFLDARSVINLAATNRRFYALLMGSSIWKSICLRDLQVAPPKQPLHFSWKDLYTSAFDGSHSYSIRQVEKHVDWMRIGAFSVDSGVVLVTDKLSELKTSFSGKENHNFKHLPADSYLISNVMTGIWIADFQLVRCPVCNLKSCEGTMQTLDIRHSELFLHKEYREGKWNYVEIGSHKVESNCNAATAGIFDAMHINTDSTKELLDLKAWAGKREEWEPKVKVSSHAAAVSTNLLDNEGLHMRYHMMKGGSDDDADGPLVAIRVSQQLI